MAAFLHRAHSHRLAATPVRQGASLLTKAWAMRHAPRATHRTENRSDGRPARKAGVRVRPPRIRLLGGETGTAGWLISNPCMIRFKSNRGYATKRTG
jgi:hypothetical protein